MVELVVPLAVSVKNWNRFANFEDAGRTKLGGGYFDNLTDQVIRGQVWDFLAISSHAVLLYHHRLTRCIRVYRCTDKRNWISYLPMNVINTCTIIMNSIQVPYPLLIKSFKASQTFPSFKCYSRSSEAKESNDFKDALFGMVDEQVQELLSRKENKVLLDGLEKASQRVEMAKRELALIQKQEHAAKQFKDYVNQLEGKVFEIAECQKEISEAKSLVEEAERSLSLNVGGPEDGGAFMGKESEEIDRDEERWESVKAASISALIGTFLGLPICFTQVTNTTQLLLPLAINFISCALFGVTFRYTIRRNLDDVQLKTGIAAAFGVVKGLATLGGGPLLELNFESFLSHAQDGTIYVSENLFIFVSAAVGLDYCFKTRLLSPFPIDRSV